MFICEVPALNVNDGVPTNGVAADNVTVDDPKLIMELGVVEIFIDKPVIAKLEVVKVAALLMLICLVVVNALPRVTVNAATVPIPTNNELVNVTPLVVKVPVAAKTRLPECVYVTPVAAIVAFPETFIPLEPAKVTFPEAGPAILKERHEAVAVTVTV